MHIRNCLSTVQKYKSTRPSQTTVKIPLLPGKTPQNPLTLLLSEEKGEKKKGTLSSKPLFSQRFSSIALPPVMFLCKYSSPKLLGIAQKSILFNMHSMLKETQRHLGRGDRLVAVHQSIRGVGVVFYVEKKRARSILP